MNNRHSNINHAKQLARDLLSYETTFRNHKETMAHAALVLQIVFFAWMMRENSRIISGGTEYYLSIILLCIFYLYVRWELRKRRFSGIRIGAIHKFLAECEDTPPKTKKPKEMILNILKSLDLLLPLPIFCSYPAYYMINSILPAEAAKKYPAALSNAIQAAAHEKALHWYIGEYLVSLISASILVIVLFTNC